MKYVYLVLALVVLWFFGTHAEEVLHLFSHGSEAAIMPIMVTLCVFSLVGALGVYLTRSTIIPSFVAYIFLGMAAKPYLEPIVGSEHATMLLVITGAVLILMQGGLETPFDNFKKLFWKILSLAFVALFVTAVLFSYGLVGLGTVLGVAVAPVVALLLGAILASTDPAAIIPVTQSLKWKDLTAKDTVVAESALSDVTGALLTFTLLPLAVAGGVADLWSNGYAHIFTIATALFIESWLVVLAFLSWSSFNGTKKHRAKSMLLTPWCSSRRPSARLRLRLHLVATATSQRSWPVCCST
jgi:NhaP-type Na+/H+ or K+/H+ antiporter